MNRTKNQLYKKQIPTNCPECFLTTGLELSFYQEEKETAFTITASKIIREHLECSNCNTVIYPVEWTEDIERLYEYHKKQVVIKKTTPRLKKLGVIVIVIGILAVIAGIFVGYTFL